MRNERLDLLKGIAVLLMIQVHVMELFAQPEILASPLGRASLFLGGPPVAPVFLAVLGYYAFRPQVTSMQLIRRGLSLLGLGLLLNAGLNLHLFWRIQQGSLLLNPLEYLFGVDVLFAAGLSLIIGAALRPALGQAPWRWLLVAALVASATPWLTTLLADTATPDSIWHWLAAYIAAPATWSYFPIFPWLAYALLGGAAHHASASHFQPDKTVVVTLLVGALVLFWTLDFAVTTSHTLPTYYHHGPVFFAWTTLFLACWGLFWLAAPLPSPLVRQLSWFGRHVTACYIAQWLLIGNIATAIYKTQSLLHCLLWFCTLMLATRLLVGTALWFGDTLMVWRLARR